MIKISYFSNILRKSHVSLRSLDLKKIFCLNTVKIRNYSSTTSIVYDEGRCMKGLVLGIYEGETPCADPKLTSYSELFNNQTEGTLTKLIKQTGLTGEIGKYRVFNGINNEFGSVCVVGLGKEGVGYSVLEALDEGMENARIAAGVGAKKLRDEGCTTIHIDPMEYAEQVAEGSALAIWRYQENKNKKDRLNIPKLELFESGEEDAWTRGLFKADAQNLARTLEDAPANQLTPTSFAQTAIDALCPCGVGVEVRNMDWIESKNMNAYLAVAKSSCEPPIFLEINYCGDSKDDKPILLAGTGITFNSGGLCLQPCDIMSNHRASMSGGAIIVSVIRAAAALSLPINITGVIPLCENMPSGMAFKPGDVLTTFDGKTIAVHNTNNAHRLCLADTLVYAQYVYQPRLVVDIATMTSGVISSLGGCCAAAFTNSDFVWKQIRKAGVLSGDRVWRLPLWKYYTDKVTSYSNVDLSNRGHGKGTPCLGAAFIKEFVPHVDWLHLDITAISKKSGCGMPYLENERMTGRPTRTLIQFLHQIACPEELERELK